MKIGTDPIFKALRPKARWLRPLALLTTAAFVALVVFFLIRGSWWTSAGLVLLWLAVEWWGVWKERRLRRAWKERQ
jgi:hypothetical protein